MTKSILNRLNLPRHPIYLIDGSSYIYRAFYAFSDLKTKDGFPTNALFIILRLLLKILRQENPKFACFVIDGKGPTFRNDIDTTYKANRLKMPEQLSMQIPPILEGVNLLGIKTVVAQGFEADDYIASMCELFKKELPIVIVGSDKDLFQLLDENVLLWDPSGKKEKLLTKENFLKQRGFSPELWPLYQALIGDSSDNIKGIPGIGPKTGLSIIKRFSSIDEIFSNLDKLSPSVHKKLKGQRENLEKFLKLTILKKDVPICTDLNSYEVRKIDEENIKPFLRRYEFSSLIKELKLDPANLQKIHTSNSENHKIKTQDLEKEAQGEDIAVLPNGSFLVATREHEGSTREQHEILKIIRAAKKVYVPSLKKLLYDIEKYDLPLDNLFDLSLGSYLIEPELRDYSLKSIVSRFSPNKQELSYVASIIDTGEYIFELLKENNLFELYENIERPLVPILISMEKNGIKIDKKKFSEFLQEVESELTKLTNKIYKYAQQEFNIRSSKQLSYILFKKMGLKPGRKTPKGEYSTSIDVLESIKNQHPIIEDILKYRKLEKLRSTYLIPLPELADQNSRIHTNFNQLATATGRLSSSNPNLQNIPIKGEFGPKMRSCFIPEQGNLIISADYSQVELRVLAHFSKDPYLVDAFIKGSDIHSSTAAALFDKPPEEVTKDERRKAKTINFGLIYGMGPKKLSNELGISMTESKKFIEKYFSKLTGVKDFFEQVEREVEENLYVTTLSGRKRHLPNITSRNNNLASQAKRMAINTKIQGSAADIIKIAMINIATNKNLKEMEVKLLLQIHDELLFECPETHGEDAAKIIKKIMSSVWELEVPLVVDIGIGKNWAEAH
ncbi:DNA polymerase I [Desulfothermus okinawensis JCM 13304]